MSNGMVLWLTGLPSAGKSTLAKRLGESLAALGHSHEILDGDVVRKTLCAGLGFSREDRDINVRRIGLVAGLLARHGVVVIVATVSPYRDTREELRRSIERFVEIYVACPVAICEQRDVKGMYAEARAGRRPHFTGADDPYEPPESPEVTVNTGQESISDSLGTILRAIDRLGYLKP